jgi:hypothetical protein
VIGVHLGSTPRLQLTDLPTGYGTAPALVIERIRQEIEPAGGAPFGRVCRP